MYQILLLLCLVTTIFATDKKSLFIEKPNPDDQPSTTVEPEDDFCAEKLAVLRTACKPGTVGRQITQRVYDCKQKLCNDKQQNSSADCFKRYNNVSKPSSFENQIAIMCKEENLSQDKIEYESYCYDSSADRKTYEANSVS